MDKQTLLAFSHVKDMISSQTEEEIAWQSETQICFEDEMLHTLIPKETEEWKKEYNLSEVVFVKNGTIKEEKSYDYSCYVGIEGIMYCVDLTIFEGTDLEISWYMYKRTEESFYSVQKDESPRHTITLILLQMINYVKESPCYRLFFATGSYKINRREEFEELKKKAGMK